MFNIRLTLKVTNDLERKVIGQNWYHQLIPWPWFPYWCQYKTKPLTHMFKELSIFYNSENGSQSAIFDICKIQNDEHHPHIAWNYILKIHIDPSSHLWDLSSDGLTDWRTSAVLRFPSLTKEENKNNRHCSPRIISQKYHTWPLEALFQLARPFLYSDVIWREKLV